MLLSEYYKDSKYSENGANYEVVDFGKNQRSLFKLRCIVCNDVNEVSAASILSGRKPCYCSKKSNNTPIKLYKKLIENCLKQKIKVLTESIANAKDKFKVTCLVCEYEWVTSYNSICLKGAGCSECKGCSKWENEDFRIRISDLLFLKDCKLILIDHKSKASSSLISIQCNKCSFMWTTVAASTLKGAGCPSCAKYGFQKSKPAFLYLIELSSYDGQLLGYKYGITSDLRRRLFQHINANKSVEMNFELVAHWYYEDGAEAVKHETTIKNSFPSFYSKNQLPGGYTETISMSENNSFLEMQNKQYKEYTDGN